MPRCRQKGKSADVRNLAHHLIAVLQLPDDADLHVVDDECGRFEIDGVLDGLWNAQAERVLHFALVRRSRMPLISGTLSGAGAACGIERM